MPLTPFAVNEFGSLNLAVDATDVGTSGAVDLLNVSVSVPGQLSTRGGYVKHNTTTPASVYQNVVETRAGGTTHLVGFRGTNLDTISSVGTVSAAAATFPANFRGFSCVDYGSPAGTRLYIADSGLVSGGGTLQKWDGAALSASSGKPGFVAVTPWDNRVVQGYYNAAADTPSGANGSKSTVFFSDVNAPDTYTSTSWVQLHPGDGESITAIVAWRDLLFVFKESAVYVFYGTSTLTDGSPVFQFRRVNLPSRVTTYLNGIPAVATACAGPEGVYYHAADGIYATTGGPPVMISGAVRGLFTGTAATSQVRHATTGAAYSFHLTCVEERVYLAYMNGDVNPRVLVFDRPSGTWALWSVTALAGPMPVNGTSLYSNSGGRVPLVADDATADIYAFGPTATTDNGTAIAWAYQTGYSSAGGYFRQRIVSSGERKKHFKTDILGSGTVTHQILALNARPNDVADTGGSVTLGTSPAIARGSRRRGVRGTYFAHKLSGSGPAVVSGLTYWLSEISQDT